MFGLGTIINTVAILVGGLIGYLFKDFLKESQEETLSKACGVSVMFIGIAGGMEGLLSIENNTIISGQSMFVVVCLTLGSIIGELIGIEKGFEKFGEWLKKKTGNQKDHKFVEAFLTTSFTVCIGAMTIVGSIQDGVLGDYSTLAVKSVLDLIIVIVMTASLGKGAIFSAIPVFIAEGSITLLAKLIAPVLSDLAIANLSLIGSMLIFCVGINVTFGKKIKVANMLPALLLAVLAAYLPTLAVKTLDLFMGI